MSEAVRRVAITGAAGYLAGGLIRRLDLEDQIERVLAIDVRPIDGEHTSKVLFHRHDVAQPMTHLFSEHGIDSVVHLAYILRPRHDRAAVRRVNVGGTANVLKACQHAEVRYILYLSSTSVYGAYPDNPALLTEQSPARPVKGFQYSENKAEAETLLMRSAEERSSFGVGVLRVCPVMGPTADNFISGAFSKPVLVATSGYDPPMQLVHEDDVADLILLCLLQSVTGVYNVAGDGDIRWSEMVSMFGRKLIRLPAPLLYGITSLAWNLRLQRDSPACGLDMVRYRWTVSTDKIKRELGVRFRYTSRDAWGAFVQHQRRPPEDERGSRK